MNSQLFPSNVRSAASPTLRAALSPIRSSRHLPVPPHPVTVAVGARSQVPLASPYLPDSSPRPHWHRSALDRMQPVLTRYRD
jgi:hypothetical protein